MTLTELEQCVGSLKEFAKEWGVTETVPDDKDLYWTIGSPDWLEIYEEPKAGVGSLDDDDAELRRHSLKTLRKRRQSTSSALLTC